MSRQLVSQLTLELADARRRDAEFAGQIYLPARARRFAEKREYSPDLAIRVLTLKDFEVIDVAPDILRWTVGPGIGQDI